MFNRQQYALGRRKRRAGLEDDFIEGILLVEVISL
jgi:hypothetical protein